VASEQELVERLATKDHRLDAMRALLGGVNATDLRAVQPADGAFHALVRGLVHENPVVRWWSVQLLDHCADVRAINALVPVLDDPVPRVRRNAVHALSCAMCKPAWSGELPVGVRGKLAEMAETDPNAKVRAVARIAVTCRPNHQPSADSEGLNQPTGRSTSCWCCMMAAVVL